nr:hypothetical protein [Tanacetum cinerariifolium]
MDDPNITMEEFIKLEEEKARRRGRVYNGEIAIYVVDDIFTSHTALSYESKSDKDNDHKEIDIIQSSRDRMLIEHRDAQGQIMLTSRDWRRLFDIRGPLVYELILEFFSTFRFGKAVLELDTAGALQFQLGCVRQCMSWREFILALGLHIAKEMQTSGFGLNWADSATQIFNKGGLSAYWIGISSTWDFLGEASRIDNYCPTLPVIDMAELVRLQICKNIEDTWAWVAQGTKRQQVATTGTPKPVEDVPVVDEGAQAIPAPVQAPQPPLASRSMPPRMFIIEEDVRKIRGAL